MSENMPSRWPCHYLKVPLMLWFYKKFRSIFHSQQFCLKNAIHWRTRTWRFFWEFAYIFRTTTLQDTYNNLWTWICYLFISEVIWVFRTTSCQSGGFYDLFWFNSTILLFKMKSLFLNLYTSPNVTDLSIDYGGRYVLV